MRTMEIFSIAFSIFVLIRLFKLTKGEFYCLIPLVVVFDFVMVVPLGIELFLGIPDTVYTNFIKSMQDITTTWIYIGFIIAAQMIFLFETEQLGRKIKRGFHNEKISDIVIRIANSKHRSLLVLLSYTIFAITLFKIALAPDPMFYFRINRIGSALSNRMSAYYVEMRSWANVLAVATLLLKVLDTKRNFLLFISRVAFIITIVFVDQKRTLLMLVVGACFLIDYLNNNDTKRLAVKYVVIFGAVAGYFYAYMYITNKISYNDDWYYMINEYIFRDMHLRLAIYACMHPSSIHILDYPGQSILFSLFYWIPRSLWPTKPWPYVYYYISGVLGYSSLNYYNIGWGMPTSYYPEFVSNFGLIGLPISILFTAWAARFFEKRKLTCKLLGTALITVLEIYYYDNAMKILAFIVLLLYLGESISINFNEQRLTFHIRKGRQKRR